MSPGAPPPRGRADPVGHVCQAGDAELGVSEQTLGNPVRQGDIDACGAERLTTDEREEPRRLRRETRRLQQQREIFKAAAALSPPRQPPLAREL